MFSVWKGLHTENTVKFTLPDFWPHVLVASLRYKLVGQILCCCATWKTPLLACLWMVYVCAVCIQGPWEPYKRRTLKFSFTLRWDSKYDLFRNLEHLSIQITLKQALFVAVHRVRKRWDYASEGFVYQKDEIFTWECLNAQNKSDDWEKSEILAKNCTQAIWQ